MLRYSEPDSHTSTSQKRRPAGKSRRAVDQIVLTATSLPEVATVPLTHDRRPCGGPLPSGELASGAHRR